MLNNTANNEELEILLSAITKGCGHLSVLDIPPSSHLSNLFDTFPPFFYKNNTIVMLFLLWFFIDIFLCYFYINVL